MQKQTVHSGFDGNLFLNERFVFMAGEAPNTEAQKTEEVKAETKKETPATPQETADKAKKELDTAKKILTDLQDTLKTGITKGSILNNEALQSTILQATEQLNAEVLKALKDSKVDDKELKELQEVCGDQGAGDCRDDGGDCREKQQGSVRFRLQKLRHSPLAPTGNLDTFFTALKDSKSASVTAFSKALGAENVTWLQQNRSAIDEKQLSGELNVLLTDQTEKTGETLAAKLKPQIETARRVLAEGQKTSSINALKQQIDSSEQEANKPKTLNDHIKEKGLIGGLFEYVSITLGLKKRPEKKKEKMSETNSGSVAKVREAYASLTKENGNKLPTNFSEVFATVGKEMVPPQKDPITDSLITEEHLALLETSGDNKISGEFLKKKMDGFLKIMEEIQGKVDSKELEFKDGKLEVSQVMRKIKDALDGKDAGTLKIRRGCFQHPWNSRPVISLNISYGGI